MTTTPATPAAQPTGTTPAETTGATGATPTEQQPEQAQPVTRKDVEEIVGRVFQRVQQSSRDRAQHVDAKIKELTDTVQKMGVTITPEITAKAREQAEAIVDQQSTQPAAQPETPILDGPGEGNPVYDWTVALYKAEGIEIKQADPEYKAVKAALEDPTGNLDPQAAMIKYQKTVIKAIDTKRERLASQQQNPDARVLGSGSGSSPVTANSARDYWNNAHK